jgi:hypothetical protein
VSRTAALSVADPTESYAEETTPWGMLRNATPDPEIRAVALTSFAACGSAISGWFEPTSKDADPMTTHAKGAGVYGANLAKVLGSRRRPSGAMLTELPAALAQDR